MKKLKLKKNILIKLYIKQQLSTLEIAKILHCSHSAIRNYLKIYKIKLRACTGTGKNNSNYKDGRTLKKYYCKDCGIKISIYGGLGKGRCHSCAIKHCFEIGKMNTQGKNNPAYIDGRKSKLYFGKCGHKTSYTSYLRGGINCKKCAFASHNNPAWQGGIGKLPYTFEFTVELKEHIRQRDNYTCQNCGMTEEEHLIVIGRVLTVHHIDYDKINCKEDNLISLCNSCNTRANFNRDYWCAYFTYIMENII